MSREPIIAAAVAKFAASRDVSFNTAMLHIFGEKSHQLKQPFKDYLYKQVDNGDQEAKEVLQILT